MNEGHSHTGANEINLDAAPPAARRLWSELFCMCGECEHIALAECTCDFAASERRRMETAFVKAGFGDAAKQQATYDVLLAEYVHRHGAAAEVASFRLHTWLDPLLTIAGALAGIIALVFIVERLRTRVRGGVLPPFSGAKRSLPKASWRRHRR